MIAASCPCSGDRAASPSTVVISHPATCPAATRQAQTGSPFSRTVQAPQSPASHPTFVPVSPRSSRSTRESRRVPGAATSTARPFTENEIDSVPRGGSFSVVAMSAAPTQASSARCTRVKRGIPPVLGRGAHIVNRRKRRQDARPGLPLPIPALAGTSDKILFQSTSAAVPSPNTIQPRREPLRRDPLRRPAQSPRPSKSR